MPLLENSDCTHVIVVAEAVLTIGQVEAQISRHDEPIEQFLEHLVGRTTNLDSRLARRFGIGHELSEPPGIRPVEQQPLAYEIVVLSRSAQRNRKRSKAICVADMSSVVMAMYS